MIPDPSSFFPLAMEISISFQIYPLKVPKINYMADNMCIDYNFSFSVLHRLRLN